VPADRPRAAPPTRSVTVFDLSQFQAVWDSIFPTVFGPLAASVDTLGASVEGP